jgi:Stress responsive A/B Barrel Domain
MIRHVVTFRWKPEATEEQKQRVGTELAALPAKVPGVRALRFGADAGVVAAGNADFALTADFDDAGAYLVYRTHPAHVEFIEQTINPILAERVSVQFEY